MDQQGFERMVARLEQESAAAPARYKLKVALLALVGFGVLGLVVALAGLGVLAIAGAALAIAVSGGAAALLLLKFGKLLVLLAWPLWVLVKSSVQAVSVRVPVPEGTEVSRNEAPELFAAIDEMRRRMRGPRFHHVLITGAVNAAVAQRPLLGLLGWPRNYLILGLPLLDSLGPREALAVVAHEYGHLAGSHSRFAAFIYRLRLSWGTVQSLTRQWKGGLSRPLQRLVDWYAPYFNAYTFVLARANEYQADAASAELVGAGVAADALKRTELAALHFNQFMGRVFDEVKERAEPPTDLSQRWAQLAPAARDAEQAPQWLNEAWARPAAAMDTHPALQQRVQALLARAATSGTTASTATSITANTGTPGRSSDGGGKQPALPAPLQGPSAAQAWLGAYAEVLRRQQQDQWRASVIQPWAERHRAVQAQRARLQALRDQAGLSRDEEIEALQLRLALEPGPELLPALQDFNARFPDHALALYLEAGQRLEQGDAAGLDLLDRVMALDADAVKPACEQAWNFLQQAAQREVPGQAARAEAYAARWREREAFEQQRAAEAGTLDVKHELRTPAGLSPEALARTLELLRGARKDIKRAWLARRVLPSDPEVATYVLGLELSWWARQRNRDNEVVNRLAELEWPMHLHVCTLAGRFAGLKKKLKALNGASLPLKG